MFKRRNRCEGCAELAELRSRLAHAIDHAENRANQSLTGGSFGFGGWIERDHHVQARRGL